MAIECRLERRVTLRGARRRTVHRDSRCLAGSALSDPAAPSSDRSAGASFSQKSIPLVDFGKAFPEATILVIAVSDLDSHKAQRVMFCGWLRCLCLAEILILDTFTQLDPARAIVGERQRTSRVNPTTRSPKTSRTRAVAA
jgi:hypothetical protein